LTVDEKLQAGEVADEFLLMGLRLVEGIEPERFTQISRARSTIARISFLRVTAGRSRQPKTPPARERKAGFPLLDAVVRGFGA